MQDQSPTETTQTQPSLADLDHLFHVDPEQLTAQDTAQLVTALREKRTKFVAKENKGKPEKAKAPKVLDTSGIKL